MTVLLNLKCLKTLTQSKTFGNRSYIENPLYINMVTTESGHMSRDAYHSTHYTGNTLETV